MVTYWLIGEGTKSSVEERRPTNDQVQDKPEKPVRDEGTQASSIRDPSSQTSKNNINGKVLNDRSSAGCEDESALPLLSISPAENYTHVWIYVPTIVESSNPELESDNQVLALAY